MLSVGNCMLRNDEHRESKEVKNGLKRGKLIFIREENQASLK